MAYHAIIIAGFGGQGIMLTGQIIAAAAVKEGKNATWLPSYGPEMRGGTANCTVIVDEKPITSPVVDHPTEVIAMNFPSMMKFGAKLRSGGLLLVNSSVVEQIIDRDDIETIEIPANEIAEEAGNVKAANMVMLGAFLELTRTVSFEAVEEVLREQLSKTKEDLLKIDLIAIKKGREFIGSLYHKSS
ncbi:MULTISPECIES: 2-oxoacid:acceptor oxidoreductase family protein [unclassified Thermotoga]|uniref:2-oxoacid:acceptor oxidoreductase family protein n=1 Tax=unclassified Thermotoga TaxID=2631113 RepID=UPI000280E8C2|nr:MULTISPECIES: 2-oxoacid:acceptor oxidoreductase family protein [unclassified Thermotoga]AIY86615.1 Pyruvate/ketoisovalerate oxidoreductase [Thermotoga sp. 2812B]EJX25859.1 Pyruvate/ketoisovalerate oxidoreductase [Thermotoga sp. EMP]